MAKARSPLKTKCIPGRHGEAGEVGIVISLRSVNGLWQVAGWDNFEDVAGNVLQSFGINSVGNYRNVQSASGITAWRIAPDKILLEGVDDLSAWGSAELAVLDLSHARAVIKLSGSFARDLLAQLVAVDTTYSHFGPDEFLQTVIDHVGVLIQCKDHDSFEIFVPSTWAETIWDVIFKNALPYGIEIKEPV